MCICIAEQLVYFSNHYPPQKKKYFAGKVFAKFKIIEQKIQFGL